MTTTDDRPTRKGLAIYPLQHLTASEWNDRFAQHLEHDPEADTSDVFGHCRRFCILEGPTSGQAVEEHGPWCESRTAVGVHGSAESDGSEITVFGAIVEAYMHGEYRRSDVWMANRNTMVRLTLFGEGIEADDGGEAKQVQLTVGEARRLAAGLAFLCDQADALDRPLRADAEERWQNGA